MVLLHRPFNSALLHRLRRACTPRAAPPGLTVATRAPGGPRPDAEPDTPATAAASAVENAATGELELNIDLSLLGLAGRRHALPGRLLGRGWRPGARPAYAAAGRRVLTLADYKRRQGIA